MQYKTATYSVDKKTGKQTKVSEEEGPKKPFKTKSISAEEFNDDKPSKAKAAILAAKAAAKAAEEAERKKRKYYTR